MRYEAAKGLSDKDYRTVTGFKKDTIEVMVEILREADEKKKKQGGRRNKNSVEDRLMMACH